MLNLTKHTFIQDYIMIQTGDTHSAIADTGPLRQSISYNVHEPENRIVIEIDTYKFQGKLVFC